jgi:hypothetical protein
MLLLAVDYRLWWDFVAQGGGITLQKVGDSLGSAIAVPHAARIHPYFSPEGSFLRFVPVSILSESPVRSTTSSPRLTRKRHPLKIVADNLARPAQNGCRSPEKSEMNPSVPLVRVAVANPIGLR